MAVLTQPTYSGGPVGSTIPGQEALSAMTSRLTTNQTLTPQQAQSAQQGVEVANQAMMNLGTEAGRQPYIDNTNLGAMQDNYSQLAQKLAEYDNVVLKPQFAGQNPGMPTDLPVNPDVYFGNVSYLTPQSAVLGASQGLYNANPSYALSAQMSEQDNLITLLNNINTLIGKERERGTAKYTSDLSNVTRALSGLQDILRLNADLEMKRLDLAERRAERGNSQGRQRKSDFQNDAANYGAMIDAGLIGWGQAWNQLRAAYPEFSSDEIDLELGGSAKQKGNETGRAKPGYFQGLSKDGITDLYKQERATRALGSVEELKDQVSDLTVGPIGWTLSKIPGTPALSFAAQVDTLKSSIISNELQAMREASTTGGALGQVSNRENEILASSIGALDTRQSPADFKKQLDKIKESIERWNKAVSDYSGNSGENRIRVRNKQTGQTGTLLEKDFNADKYERI